MSMKKFVINAIYLREMRRATRDIKLPIFIFIYLLMLSTTGIVALLGIFSGQDNFTNLKDSFFVLYKILYGAEFALLMLLIPSMTAGAISGERENKTLELLLATTMSPYRIVIGKLLPAISRIFFYVIASFPILGLVFIIGGAAPVDISEYLLLLFTTSFYIGSFSVLMSVLFTRTAQAMIAAYTSFLIFCVGTILIVVLDNTLLGNNKNLDLIDYSLLFNPIATIYIMLSQQLGVIGKGLEFVIVKNANEKDLLRSWFSISLFLQWIVVVLNLFLAGFFLNPLRKK